MFACMQCCRTRKKLAQAGLSELCSVEVRQSNTVSPHWIPFSDTSKQAHTHARIQPHGFVVLLLPIVVVYLHRYLIFFTAPLPKHTNHTPNYQLPSNICSECNQHTLLPPKRECSSIMILSERSSSPIIPSYRLETEPVCSVSKVCLGLLLCTQSLIQICFRNKSCSTKKTYLCCFYLS